jgi:hypothetical protein
MIYVNLVPIFDVEKLSIDSMFHNEHYSPIWI